MGVLGKVLETLTCLKIEKYQIVEIIGIGWTGDDAGATQASSTT